MNNISNKVFQLKDIINGCSNQEEISARNELYISLNIAKREWENAKNIFENVSNPDLVDYAIYNIDAAEKRYMYLLKQMKNYSA